MPSNVQFKFGLDPKSPAITARHDIWAVALPLSRRDFTGRPGAIEGNSGTTYGNYFDAARDFLARDDYQPLRDAASRATGRVVTSKDLRQVSVYLLKHGAFYHPACIDLALFDRRLLLVLNVAVSRIGRERLPEECACLARLEAELPQGYWPEVYVQGRGRARPGHHLPMFLGPWFDGFYEFHLTGEASGDQATIVVWDTDKGSRLLTGRPVSDLLCRAASILTYAYNPLTFDAILDWHHAAGDFVVRIDGDRIDLRLITVRRYGPLVKNLAPDVEAVLDGLLLFLVSLTFRLRLDRLDGTGDPALYPETVLPSICEGFWQGLKLAVAAREIPEDILPAVRSYLGLHDAERLVPLAEAVLANYPVGSDEGRLLRARTGAHLASLAGALASSAGHE